MRGTSWSASRRTASRSASTTLTFGLAIEPKAALTLSSMVAFGPAYAASRSWTFRTRTRHAVSLWRYAAGYLASFAFQAAFLWLGVDALGVPHQYVVLAGLGLATVFFFLLQRIWIFRSPALAGSGSKA